MISIFLCVLYILFMLYMKYTNIIYMLVCVYSRMLIHIYTVNLHNSTLAKNNQNKTWMVYVTFH